jgi:hypothetical protein
MKLSRRNLIRISRGKSFGEATDSSQPAKSFIVVIAFLAVVGLTMIAMAVGSAAGQSQMNVPDNADFSKFKHASAYHARLPCALCHRRDNNSALPAFPGKNNHLPCAGCHAKQFADSSSQICTICHSDAQSGSMKAFPRLSTFNMKFNHSQHVRAGGSGCVTCHKPGRGASMTIPAGLNAHNTCFVCHSSQAKSGDREISSCGVCHQLDRYVRTSQTAPAFKRGFSHEKHNQNEHLSCSDCHRVRTGLARNQVSSPQPLNHHAALISFSCRSCHDGKKAFGGDDFSACRRCHTGEAWHF